MLYQSILNATLTGRRKLVRKSCTSKRDDRNLENTVKQSRFKHLGELHKEWTEVEGCNGFDANLAGAGSFTFGEGGQTFLW